MSVNNVSNDIYKCLKCNSILIQNDKKDIIPGCWDNEFFCNNCHPDKIKTYIICSECKKCELFIMNFLPNTNFKLHQEKRFLCISCFENLNKNEIKEKSKGVNNEMEEIFCCVCLSNRANTLVLPCQHCVVCKECSEELKSSLNAKKCVYCRTLIEEVLMDEK